MANNASDRLVVGHATRHTRATHSNGWRNTVKRTLPTRANREPRSWYSVAEVARMLGMSQMTVYRAIAEGSFPAVKIRGRLIVPAKALAAMEDAATTAQGVVDSADYVPPSTAGAP
ncbi:helix-turn-helix domain-containing protein [Phytoactinopolyspora alkaliphila]|uniref:Helix-turn-helix domain-containing protein n=1 Tax=Phytoactinopolyspora alkaliphila TaxID=1783498 RepID=A0A6N9YPC4_9ACTN|nr:helix-turn-helix domain-containing protein [Phytoactinopolyspora alkaliphila]NED96824.1 helix-turn-helix domain-containing protein [Phytoactinopolyspora alkaliphila]